MTVTVECWYRLASYPHKVKTAKKMALQHMKWHTYTGAQFAWRVAMVSLWWCIKSYGLLPFKGCSVITPFYILRDFSFFFCFIAVNLRGSTFRKVAFFDVIIEPCVSSACQHYWRGFARSYKAAVDCIKKLSYWTTKITPTETHKHMCKTQTDVLIVKHLVLSGFLVISNRTLM